MTKNIVWLHSHFLFWMGGTKFIFEVIKQIAVKKGYHVLVIVEDAGPLAQEQYQELGVELISLKSWSSTKAGYWLGLPWFINRRSEQIAHILKNKHLSAQNTTVISSMFPMNAVANQLPFKHIQLCYEPFAFFYDQAFIATFPLLKKLFIQMIATFWAPIDLKATQQSQTVMTLNQVTQDLIQDVYSVKARLVYAGVDSERFKPYVSPSLLKEYQGRPVAIHSTDYSPVKGTDRVIKAMHAVVQKVPQAQLLITSTIANPAAEARLRALSQKLRIEKHVRFLGFLPIELLPEYYSLAQVLVQGSNSTKSGTTSMALPVKEAMCCETPAIRPDAGGEDVVDGVSGFLVDPSNTQLLADKMTLLLSDKALSQKMGKAARKAIVTQYTWQKTAKRILAHV